MPAWDDATRTRFIRGEQTLVSWQLETGAVANNVWAAWQDLTPLIPYAQLLVEERFDEIINLVQSL